MADVIVVDVQLDVVDRAVESAADIQLRLSGLEAAIRENVKRQVELLQSSQPVLAGLVQGGKTKVIGAEYDITSGHVERL